MNNDLLSKLRAIVGDGGLLVGADVQSRSADFFSTANCEAKAIVRPASTEEVSAVLKLCYEANQPVVPLGGNTGLVRGGIAGPDEILLSTERMNTIEELDSQNRTITVQAGVTMQAVQERAEDEGFMYPVDLGAKGTATIGGNIATNAGGNRVVRYGMTRSQILGLEVVLADGTVMSSLGKLMKDNTGYDLKQLFIGSEGTLGIVTRAVLRLRPAMNSTNVAFLAVSEFSNLPVILKRVDAALGGSLSAFEVMWGEFYHCIMTAERDHNPPLPDGSAYYVLVENQGAGEAQTEELFQNALMSLLESGLVEDAAIAQSKQQCTAMWDIREDIESLVHFLGAGAKTFDISLPLDKMEDYIATIKTALQALNPDIKCIVFGHLGDGNLHLGISLGSVDTDPKQIETIVYTPLKDIGGSVSAEHGIGLEKKPYLSLSRSDAELAMMANIKSMLDPKNILNPGRLIG